MHHQILAIYELGLKNQLLIGHCLDLGRIYEAKQLQYIDRELLLLRYKMLGNSTQYIWHTLDDKKVRPSHAENDEKIFSWNKKPATGHPGEDYGCRCWAEPVGAKEYARQFLITPINDSDKWTDIDFIKRYLSDIGGSVTLEETGHLGGVIEHFSYTLEKYNNVNKQIIEAAKTVVEGPVPYDFNNTYEFGNFWDLILFNGRYSLGESTVKGVFDGDVRKEKDFLVISGVMSYEFSDEFSDPFEKIERVQIFQGVSREDAEKIIGADADENGIPYNITGSWQTKFNATVKLNEN